MSLVAIFDTVGTFSPTSYTTSGSCPEICLAYVAYSTSTGSAFNGPGTLWGFDVHSYQTFTMTSALVKGGVSTVCLPVAATQAFLKTQGGYATYLGSVDTLSIVTSEISKIATGQSLASCGSLPGTVMLRRSLLGSQISSINFYTDPASGSGASISTSVMMSSSTASVTSRPSAASAASTGPATVTVVSGPSPSGGPPAQANDLGTGVKVGIGVGVSVAVLIILGVLMFALHHRRKYLAARKAGAGEPARREPNSAAAAWNKPELQGQPRSELQGASDLSELPMRDRFELDPSGNTEKLDAQRNIKELPAEEVANEVSNEVAEPRKQGSD